MHRFIKIKLSLLIATLIGLGSMDAAGQESQEDLTDKLWEAIGGKENWQNARYFMFSCVGADTDAFAPGERKYLWDKQTGNCRFEGTTTDDEAVVVLFNVKTHEGSVYINGTKLDNPNTASGVIAAVASEFERDAYLLFLPTALEGNRASYTVAGEKLIGSQRFAVVNIKNPKTSFQAAVDGQLYIDMKTGLAQSWKSSRSGNHYTFSGFKDIGGGLVLPTRFTGVDSATSITYPIAAALVSIEAQKFNNP